MNGDVRRWGGWWPWAAVGGITLSVIATMVIGLLGPSVVVPPLPGPAWQPPYSLDVHPGGRLVVALEAAAVILGVLGLTAGLIALRRGWRPDPRVLLLAGCAAAVVLALLPPSGSADHLNYAAYGRMVTLGHDPYATGAMALPGDPIADSVEVPWREEPSVYGPVATATQALASLVGGESVRLTVFVLAILNALAFAATGLLLHRFTREDRAWQARAALLWTANPLVIYQLLAGLHVDTLAVVFVIGALVIGARTRMNASAPASRKKADPSAAEARRGTDDPAPKAPTKTDDTAVGGHTETAGSVAEASAGTNGTVAGEASGSVAGAERAAVGGRTGTDGTAVGSRTETAGSVSGAPAGTGGTVAGAGGVAVGGRAGVGGSVDGGRAGAGGPVLRGRVGWASGVLLGLGIAVKVNVGLVSLGPAWALRRSPKRLAVVAGTAAITVLVAYFLAGPHALDQVLHASKSLSLATPWRLVQHGLQGLVGEGSAYRGWIQAGSLLVLLLLALAFTRALSSFSLRPRRLPHRHRSRRARTPGALDTATAPETPSSASSTDAFNPPWRKSPPQEDTAASSGEAAPEHAALPSGGSLFEETGLPSDETGPTRTAALRGLGGHVTLPVGEPVAGQAGSPSGEAGPGQHAVPLSEEVLRRHAALPTGEALFGRVGVPPREVGLEGSAAPSGESSPAESAAPSGETSAEHTAESSDAGASGGGLPGRTAARARGTRAERATASAGIAASGDGVLLEGGDEAARVAVAVVAAWLFATPYALPWYDGLGFALLAMVTATPLDGFMTARLAILSLAYVPARQKEMPDDLQWLVTTWRGQIVPWLLLALTIAVGWWALRAAKRPAGSRRG
ncbi:hypothetical protein Ssi03_26570 [Sphaerisporangium siamense]|uniref:DUF2029 domain-containing protein n=1 Tax=Sphaerisporangium siamense TaxID=795645 RepID=A0A7W7GAH8_9ACTN|nr:polyprenol phosphomannose-dependent alpha 1,6 mannosyltransferase MptB [Sphaerisporangium siamense]MBB4700016.1 hypothetical protein [Sphaerisporangium siamense]GII84667.1 hypothetical protein Ssi03_26570 [Sphaerisporangium siamense]